MKVEGDDDDTGDVDDDTGDVDDDNDDIDVDIDDDVAGVAAEVKVEGDGLIASR